MSALPLATDYAIFWMGFHSSRSACPVEFKEGAFPTAVSLPLMTDEERARVGICVTSRRSGAAITPGHPTGGRRGARAHGRLAGQGCASNPTPCSTVFAVACAPRCVAVLADEGRESSAPGSGGSRATFSSRPRRALCAECTDRADRHDWLADPHAGAHCPGGGSGRARPSQGRRFASCRGATRQHRLRNRLAIELLQRRNQMANMFVLEDESCRLIGRCAPPLNLYEAMPGSLVVVEVPQEANGRADPHRLRCRISGCAIWSSMGRCGLAAVCRVTSTDAMARLKRRPVTGLSGTRWVVAGRPQGTGPERGHPRPSV